MDITLIVRSSTKATSPALAILPNEDETNPPTVLKPSPTSSVLNFSLISSRLALPSAINSFSPILIIAAAL